MKHWCVFIMIIVAVGMVSCGEFFSDMKIKVSLNEGLVGYWPILGNEDPQQDFSDKGNDVSYLLTPNPLSSFTTGKFGTAYSFTALGGEYAANSNISNIDFSRNDTVSISCWMNLLSISENQATIIQVENTELSFNNSSSAYRLQFQISSSTYAGYTGLTIGSWQYVTGTYDGRTIRLYVNGELVGETQSQNQLSNPSAIYFHNSSVGDLYIDEVRIYDRALRQDEIKELMGMGM